MSHNKTLGLSDIIGPIMIGPSSSHTAGALRIALMTHDLLNAAPQEMRFTMYGSFAQTYRGHGTDRALVAGLLGFRTDDLRIRDSFEIARAQGIKFGFQVDKTTKPRHPNTVDIWVRDANGDELTVRGESIGGGAARLTQVDGVSVEVTGEYSAAIIYQRDVPGVLGFVAATIGKAGINIGTSNLYRKSKGGVAYNVLEVDSPIPDSVMQQLLADDRVMRIRFIPADAIVSNLPKDEPRFSPEEAERLFAKLDYQDGTAILTHAYSHNENLGQAFLDREELLLAMQGKGMNVVSSYLGRAMQVMIKSVTSPLRHRTQTMGGLIGGEAHALTQLTAGAAGAGTHTATTPGGASPDTPATVPDTPATVPDTPMTAATSQSPTAASASQAPTDAAPATPQIAAENQVTAENQIAAENQAAADNNVTLVHDVFDNVFSKAATYAMAVLETNASMGRIVAAPTAGSAGVLPGVIIALNEVGNFSNKQLQEALANAAAVGYIVTRNATVAGAEGGCQAEMGTASAMAASAATQLLGGSPQQCLAAAAIAITNMLGLVCDPVGGLVEEPCQKRNASAATNALVSAQLALAGIHSTAFFDETVDAMYRVGHSLPFELRETALGGIATCSSCLARCGRADAVEKNHG